MTELILDGEGGKNITPSSPQAIDIDALRERFLPQPGEEFGIDDFQMAGIGVVETVRGCGTILGELAEIGWQVLRPHIRWSGNRIENRTEWESYCASLWGCSRATVSKAWTSATSTLECPQDMSVTTFYEILSGTRDDKEADRVVDLALKHGWRSYHIRLIKRLHDTGLLPAEEWVLPKLTRRGDQLYVYLRGIGGAHFATVRDDDSLARIGVFLLTDGAGIREDQELIEGKVRDELS